MTIDSALLQCNLRTTRLTRHIRITSIHNYISHPHINVTNSGSKLSTTEIQRSRGKNFQCLVLNKMPTSIQQLVLGILKENQSYFCWIALFLIIFFLYLKITEPISNNTKYKQDFLYCESCQTVIRPVYSIINQTCAVD